MNVLFFFRKQILSCTPTINFFEPFMKKPLLCLATLVLFGCSQHSSEQKKENDGVNDPHYKIVFLDSYYTNYVAEVKKDYPNKRNIYIEKVVEPLIAKYFSKCEYLELFKEGFSYFTPDTVGILHAASEVKANKKEIEELINKSITKCATYLKNDSITFFVEPPAITDSQILQQMGGVTGLTIGRKQILITIDTKVKDWKQVLQESVAHEFHHAYWTNKYYDSTYKWNMLNYLVFEGKADSFTRLLYPDAKMPWTTALGEKEKAELWTKIKPRLSARNPLFMTEVMFGSNNYPAWGGYTLGYSIVQSALKKNPKLQLEEWTKLDSEKILEMSDWK
jgi:uncharacterized protein YjaZ